MLFFAIALALYVRKIFIENQIGVSLSAVRKELHTKLSGYREQDSFDQFEDKSGIQSDDSDVDFPASQLLQSLEDLNYEIKKASQFYFEFDLFSDIPSPDPSESTGYQMYEHLHQILWLSQKSKKYQNSWYQQKL